MPEIKSNHDKKVLVFDIGGTKVQAGEAKLSIDGDVVSVTPVKGEVRIEECANFASLMKIFTKRHGLDFSAYSGLSFGAAGILKNAVVYHTPYPKGKLEIGPWCKKNSIKSFIINNDFSLEAKACLTKVMSKAVCLPGGCGKTVGSKPNIVIIGAGTGLGMAKLIWENSLKQYLLVSGEGGHSPCPWSPEVSDLLEFLSAKGDHGKTMNDMRLELLASGEGLSIIHAYLTGQRGTSKWLSPKDTPAKISAKGIGLFLYFLGLVCRREVLSNYGENGVKLVLSGGVLRREYLERRSRLIDCWPRFIDGLCGSKSRAQLLKKVPVYLQVENSASLWGGAKAFAEYTS